MTAVGKRKEGSGELVGISRVRRKRERERPTEMEHGDGTMRRRRGMWYTPHSLSNINGPGAKWGPIPMPHVDGRPRVETLVIVDDYAACTIISLALFQAHSQQLPPGHRCSCGRLPVGCLHPPSSALRGESSLLFPSLLPGIKPSSLSRSLALSPLLNSPWS